VSGNKPSYDFYASFEVADAAKEEVTVAIMQPGPFGASGACGAGGAAAAARGPPQFRAPLTRARPRPQRWATSPWP
jgi:hypothetical protein